MTSRERNRAILEMHRRASELRRNQKMVEQADQILAEAETLKLEGLEEAAKLLKEMREPPVPPPAPKMVTPAEKKAAEKKAAEQT